ncbi:MAG: hypothetical protein M8353_00085 [ANME-2 cluster archaeon]|nr:hypothetical protein [ANME-2 cluster archaeon]
MISIIPAQVHISFELSLRAGWFATSTLGEPGAQGAVVTGIQGIGVKTPRAAAVADATVGFAIEVHITKGIMFNIGTLSIIVAIGVLVVTILTGRTVIELGAVPKLHFSIAPLHTREPMYSTSMLV